ncbi:uncharacterized protein [Antedon mediterranea]|uniref:uncharacterized protein n=1 Tax=Antedon mediterranea TaxID=105859 RepID=UPI003AF7F649
MSSTQENIVRYAYAKKVQTRVGVSLTLSSISNIILGIVAVKLPTLDYAFLGIPVWSGAVNLIAGTLCWSAAKGTIKCLTLGGISMSIISIVCATIQIISMALAANSEKYLNEYCLYSDSYRYYRYDDDNDRCVRNYELTYL